MSRQHDTYVVAQGTFRVVLTRTGRVATAIEVEESALGPLHLLFEVAIDRAPIFQTGSFLGGIKHGVAEMDLLAIRHEAGESVIGWHVEVQVSFRPVTYIAKLTDDMARVLKRVRTNASARTPDQIEMCASEWVQSKIQGGCEGKRPRKTLAARAVAVPSRAWPPNRIAA